MILRQKRVRESGRFSPRYIHSGRNERELAISNYATAIIQFALGIALLIVSYQSFAILTKKLNGLSAFSWFAIPALFLLGSLVTLKSSVSSFLGIRSEVRRNRETPGRQERE
jgi:hypothetical protein